MTSTFGRLKHDGSSRTASTGANRMGENSARRTIVYQTPFQKTPPGVTDAQLPDLSTCPALFSALFAAWASLFRW